MDNPDGCEFLLISPVMEPGVNHNHFNLLGKLVSSTLFSRILTTLAQSDILGRSTSPTVFVVYAHNNNVAGNAQAQFVQQVIKWLKALRAQILSDKSPFSPWSDRSGGSAAAHNILSNQFCILPSQANRSQDSEILSVDKVLLFNSEVLKEYFDQPSTQSYFNEIEEAWLQCQSPRVEAEELQMKIRAVVNNWNNKPEFHHVLTELAMLKIRRSSLKVQNHGIIPIALDGVDVGYIAFLERCDLFLKLKSTTLIADLHALFFNILRQLYPQEIFVIDAFHTCYEQVSKLITEDLTIIDRFDNVLFNEIMKAQNLCIEHRSARIRDIGRTQPLNLGK